MAKDQKELCQIRIMFPVESDEQAIEYKKKISALLVEIPEAQLQFVLLPIPPKTGANLGGLGGL